MAGGKRRRKGGAATAAAASAASVAAAAAAPISPGRRTPPRRRRAQPDRYDATASAGAAASSAADLQKPSANGDSTTAAAAAAGTEATSSEKSSEGDGGGTVLAHRTAVLPALRYVRPSYLQSAIDALKQQQQQDTKSDMDVDVPENGGGDGGEMQTDEAGVASAEEDIESTPLRRQRRRQEVLAGLRSDPALAPLFGTLSLGLRHRAVTAFGEGASGSGGGGSMHGGSGHGTDDFGAASEGGTTLRPDWDGVRYNQFYYPQDYVEEEEGEDGDGTADTDADTARSNADVEPNSSPRKSKRRRTTKLAPGVLPVSRAVTVLAMTRDNNMVTHRYLAVGDTAGFVTLYVTEPILSQVGRVATTASTRDYESELATRSRYGGSRHQTASASDNNERQRAGAQQKRGGTRFAGYRTVVDSSRPLVAQMPHAVEALAFSRAGTRIAAASKFEVELFDCQTGTMLWSCPTTRLFGVSSTAAVSVSDSGTGRLLLAEGAAKMARRAPLKLSFHPTREDGDIVAGYEFDAWTKKDQEEEDEAGVSFEDRDPNLVSPLLQFATGSQRDVGGNVVSSNVKVRGIIPSEDAGSPLALGSRAMAIHDESDPNRLLMVVINNNPRAEDVEKDLAWRKKMTSSKMDHSFPHLQELLLVDASSSSFEVLHRTVLPSRSGSKAKVVTVEALCQSPGGTYTAAATSWKGGIRLYRTDGLVHLATYGEGIKLHNSTIMWQELFIIQRGNKKGRAEEREDELSLRTSDSPRSGEARGSASSAVDYTDLMLVGVPGAFRGPIDLNDRIHIWDLADVGWGGTKSPAMTLIAPPKSNGITSLLYDGRPGSSVGDSARGGGGGRFVISTQSGDCHQFGSKMVSDWPGRMFSAGYTVLNDNVEYVEDEDELDVVVDNHPIDLLSQGSSDMLFGLDSPEKRGQRQAQLKKSIDQDLKSALEASMYDADVDILGVDATSTAERQKSSSSRIVSARPEPYLKSRIDSSHGLVGDSTNTQINGGEFDAMSLIPGAQGIIKEEAEKNQAREDAKTDALETVTTEVYTKGRTISATNPNGPKKKRGNRRAGAGNKFEGLLKESINPGLKAIMIKRENWSNGEGSVLRHTATETVANKPPGGSICEACLGRPVHHRCGLRLNPAAIERAEEERRQKEEEEKRRATAERKKESNRLRLEAKKKKLQEEQERSAQMMRQLQQEEEERRERLRLDALARQNAVARQEAAQMQQDALVLISQGRGTGASIPSFASAPVLSAPTTATTTLPSQMRQDAMTLMAQATAAAVSTASVPSATSQMPTFPATTVAADALVSVSSSQALPVISSLQQSLTPPPPQPTVLPPSQTTRRSPQEEEQERQNIALQLLGMAPMRPSPPSAPAPSALTTQASTQPATFAPSANPSREATQGHLPIFQSQVQSQVSVAGSQGNGHSPSTLLQQLQQQPAHPPAQNAVLSALEILAQQSQVYNNTIMGNGTGSGAISNPAHLQAQEQLSVAHGPNATSAAALLQMASVASAHRQNETAATRIPPPATDQPLVGITMAPQGERSTPPSSSLPLKKRGPMHHDNSGAT